MSDDSNKLENLYNSLAEESLQMSDLEFEEELKSVFNTSTKEEAGKVKEAFSLSLKAFQENNKAKASQATPAKSSSLLNEIFNKQLPEKIEYIKNIVKNCKKYGIPEPTLQFRNLETLNEEDAHETNVVTYSTGKNISIVIHVHEENRFISRAEIVTDGNGHVELIVSKEETID